MKEWRRIIKEINNSLSSYSHTVCYKRPAMHGDRNTCGYFVITIKDDYEWKTIESALHHVAKDWDLDLDWSNLEGDVDLNAYWDCK